MKTAVALFVYRRIEFLPAILKAIREANPPRVYVFGDGPRTDDDTIRCSAVRRLVGQCDWASPVVLRFSDTNMGVRDRLTSGIDEVFQAEESAVFLDDDVILSDSFFGFCDELLERFRHDTRVAMISGVNPLGAWRSGGGDYFFSRMGNAQAWASWRRAWSLFATAREQWRKAETRASISQFLNDAEQYEYHRSLYDLPIDSPVSSWDYQWEMARHAVGALSVVPSRNLAVHAGRGIDSTHVVKATLLDELLDAFQLPTPLQHPAEITPDGSFDRLVFEATHDRLSGASARWLASALIGRGRKLMAVALLRHVYRGIEMDEEARALIREAIGRL